jgi:Zn-dependent M28 family amino/carboxypeptidase
MHIRIIVCEVVLLLVALPCRGEGLDMEMLERKLYQHVRILSVEIGERSLAHYAHLEQAAEYTRGYLKGLGYRVEEQVYRMEDRDYRNLIAVKPGGSAAQEVIVVGAHYDTVAGTPGADDNASGVAGLLELARLCQGTDFKRTIKFVAFSLEEPPVFRSPYMGSRVYAQRAHEAGEDVVAMLCLESIGYYSGEEGSQGFPLPLMGLFYPSRGNFVAVVGNFSSRRLVQRVARGLKQGCKVPVEMLIGPSLVPGVDFSDHASFWREGYPAVMITDSAFCRNPHYHMPTDMIDTLDFGSLAEVVKGLLHTIRILALF